MVQTLGLLPGLFTAGAIVALCPQVSLAEIFDGNWVTSWLTLSTMLHIQITVLISLLFYLLIISLNKTSAPSWREQIQKLFWVFLNQFSSVQLSHSVVSNSLWPHEPQHARPPYPSPTPGVYPKPCPLTFNYLILCRPPLLLPSIFPRIRVFSNESALHIRWPKYWSSIGVSLQYFHFHPITPHLVHFFPHTTVHPILPFRASICFNCFITITAE